MRGLFDIICILWAGFKKELSMSGKDELNKLLCDKFSRALTEFFPIFEVCDKFNELITFKKLVQTPFYLPYRSWSMFQPKK